MKRVSIFITALVLSITLTGQIPTDQVQSPANRANSMLEDVRESRLTIGGYGQIDYNQPIESGKYRNGNLDVHRFVLLFGYRFTDKLQLISEIEIEHVKEVYVEQAFLNYRLNDFINLRGGLLLIPMGIVNEYHEPPTFNGVERPNVDKYIVPTTWREIGAGISGTIAPASMKYQLYVVNGFSGYGETANFNGKNGLRGGRQKGAESYIGSPNVSFKVDYFGFAGLNIGLAGYFGKSQSRQYDGLDRNDQSSVKTADSTVIGTAMFGLDMRYNKGGLQMRGQLIYNDLSNVLQYNTFTGNDLGSAMLGYYIEAGYDVLRHLNGSAEQKLVPFARFEKYNTHLAVPENTTTNPSNDRTDITVGLGFWFTSGAVVKADYQAFSNAGNQNSGQFNMGIGFMF